MELTHLQLLLTTLGITLTTIMGFVLTFWKLLDSRLTRTDDILLELSKGVSEASGKNVTLQACIINSKEADARMREHVSEVKTEVLTEVEAVEFRLDKRIEKLENKVK